MTDTLKETSVSVPDLSSDPCDLAAALLTSVPPTSEKSVPNLSGAAAAGGVSRVLRRVSPRDIRRRGQEAGPGHWWGRGRGQHQH